MWKTSAGVSGEPYEPLGVWTYAGGCTTAEGAGAAEAPPMHMQTQPTVDGCARRVHGAAMHNATHVGQFHAAGGGRAAGAENEAQQEELQEELNLGFGDAMSDNEAQQEELQEEPNLGFGDAILDEESWNADGGHFETPPPQENPIALSDDFGGFGGADHPADADPAEEFDLFPHNAMSGEWDEHSLLHAGADDSTSTGLAPDGLGATAMPPDVVPDVLELVGARAMPPDVAPDVLEVVAARAMPSDVVPQRKRDRAQAMPTNTAPQPTKRQRARKRAMPPDVAPQPGEPAEPAERRRVRRADEPPRGVGYQKTNRIFEARVWIKLDNPLRGRKKTSGIQVFLGCYDTEEKAQAAHDLAAIKCDVGFDCNGLPYVLNHPEARYAEFMEQHRDWSERDFVWKLRSTADKFSTGQSAMKGVTVRTRKAKSCKAKVYEARLSQTEGGRKRVALAGQFSDEQEAGRAYDRALLFVKRHVEEVSNWNVVTNFRPSTYTAEEILAAGEVLEWR